MSTIHIVVVGASGRMGQRIISLATDDSRVHIIGAVVRDASSVGITSSSLSPHQNAIGFKDARSCAESLAGASNTSSCIIDFSSETGLISSIALAQAASKESSSPCALLVGTTGLSAASIDLLRRESSHRAVLLTPNTSLGVAAVTHAARTLAQHLGPAYRLSVTETHHTRKKDAPSGTAKKISAALRDGGATIDDQSIVSHRIGEVIGAHAVTFTGPRDVITLSHEATSRDLFAQGAIDAAVWLAGRQPGWYTIENVLEKQG